MLITKTNPSGVDFYIQELQTLLHNRLVAEIGVDPAKFEAYGRCYRNKDTKNGFIAEVFTSGKEYKEVYWNDKLAMISFFGCGQSVKVGISNEVDVHLVVFANLKKLALTDGDGNLISHRADEELRGKFQAIIGKASKGFQIQSIETGMENVLKEYPGSRRDDRMKAVDMHPVHTFRINFKLMYKANKIC